MKMDAGRIFDTNEGIIAKNIGNPNSVEEFYKKYLVDDFEIEGDYWISIADVQRAAFIEGFKVGASLVSCSVTKARARMAQG
jgi:hypothetical protein